MILIIQERVTQKGICVWIKKVRVCKKEMVASSVAVLIMKVEIPKGLNLFLKRVALGVTGLITTSHLCKYYKYYKYCK